jgi:carbamoyltransferase
MGLAPYGEPVYEDAILDQVVDVQSDGSFRLNQDYFAYLNGTRMTSPKFNQLFGGPARNPEAQITEREQNLAASIQRVTEMILIAMAEHLHRKTGLANLCLAGGVALNCVANGRLLREGPFENVWVQPAAGDSGAALGAALFVSHQLLDHPRMVPSDRHLSMFLGPSHSEDQITKVIHGGDAVVRRFEKLDSLYDFVVEQLNQQKVVGWSQGRMEFGRRALGGRSILADPRSPTMKDRLNARVKFREPFRPFAPVALESKSSTHFHLDRPSPHMTLALASSLNFCGLKSAGG